jgi:hypothetical protein
MSKECRDGYGFSNKDKEMVRKFSNGLCALSGDLHNNIVHHVTGCYIAKLDGIPKDVISDPYQNAIMLSDEMAELHDKEEAYQVACLEYEKRGRTIYEGRTYTDPYRRLRLFKRSHSKHGRR